MALFCIPVQDAPCAAHSSSQLFIGEEDSCFDGSTLKQDSPPDCTGAAGSSAACTVSGRHKRRKRMNEPAIAAFDRPMSDSPARMQPARDNSLVAGELINLT